MLVLHRIDVAVDVAAIDQPAHGALPARQTELTAVIQSVPVEETAVVTNGDQQPGDLREQLTVIQELLALAEAKQVTLSGKISVDLHAEVSF